MLNKGGIIRGKSEFPVIVLVRKGEVLIAHSDFDAYAKAMLDRLNEEGVE